MMQIFLAVSVIGSICGFLTWNVHLQKRLAQIEAGLMPRATIEIHDDKVVFNNVLGVGPQITVFGKDGKPLPEEYCWWGQIEIASPPSTGIVRTAPAGAAIHSDSKSGDACIKVGTIFGGDKTQ